MAGGKIEFSGKGQAGNLLDPNNWAGGVVPGIGNSAIITMNVGGPVSGTFDVTNMMLLGTEDITFTGTLDTFGNIALCQGLMVCAGAVADFAPGATLNDTGVLIVGNAAVGTVLAQGVGTSHSIINSVDAKLGAEGDGTGIVTIDDGIWKNSGVVIIGNEGAGTLNVKDGGMVLAEGEVVMGVYAGSSGKMTIASGGSVSVTGLLRVGASGIASLSVGSGSSLTVDGTLQVGVGSQVLLTGGTVSGGVISDCIRIMPGGVISGFGTLASPDGLAILDDGTICATGGTLDVTGNVIGTGTIQIAANSTATLTGSSLGLASIAFIGADATLSLAHGSDVAAAISGFAIGDMISMANISAVSFNASTGMLKLSENNVQVEGLHIAGSFTGDTFVVHQLAGGAMIALQHS